MILRIGRWIVYIVSLGIIMKYDSRNSARLITNRNIFQIFDEYIFCLPQGTLTQLNFCLQNNTKHREAVYEASSTCVVMDFNLWFLLELLTSFFLCLLGVRKFSYKILKDAWRTFNVDLRSISHRNYMQKKNYQKPWKLKHNYVLVSFVVFSSNNHKFLQHFVNTLQLSLLSNIKVLS